MPFWEFSVTETLAMQRHYVVEAEDKEAAEEKAGIGDTVYEEDDGKMGEVTNRDVFECLGEVDEPEPMKPRFARRPQAHHRVLGR